MHCSVKIRLACLLSSSALARFSNSSNNLLTSSISRRNRRSCGSAGSPSASSLSASSFSARRMAVRCSAPMAKNCSKSHPFTTLMVAKIMFWRSRSCFFCHSATERSKSRFSRSAASMASWSGGGNKRHTPWTDPSTPFDVFTRHFTRPDVSSRVQLSFLSSDMLPCLYEQIDWTVHCRFTGCLRCFRGTTEVAWCCSWAIVSPNAFSSSRMSCMPRSRASP
uniref:Putative secreted protein n=1 Tax=Anopheles darlingi TaxID=43151 RepID=A0A2M4DCX6_ANODA